MRKVILLLLVAFSMIVKAQEVAGVSFGESYEKCKQVLDKRFNNGEDSYQREKGKLNYYDVTFANENFSRASFEFQVNDKGTYLNYARFEKYYELNEVQKAKEKRDRLFELYSQRYKQRYSYIDDEDGFKKYFFSYGKYDDFIYITTSKGKNRGGQMKYWTAIEYGPINIINPTDEI